MSEDWPDPEAIRDRVRQGWVNRFHDDMIVLLQRGLDAPIYDTFDLTHERVNQELHEIFQALNDVSERRMRTIAALQEELDQMKVQLAKPPAPWKTFGTVRFDEDVTFWGDDGTGLPIWERPTKFHDRETIARAIAHKRRMSVGDGAFLNDPPLGKDYTAADAVIEYFEEGMNDG